MWDERGCTSAIETMPRKFVHPGRAFGRNGTERSAPVGEARSSDFWSIPSRASLISRYDIDSSRVIQSFKNADTRALHEGHRVKRLVGIESVARRKLAMLNATASLEFLRVPPGNRLEALKGDRVGLHSIRINHKWRLCFEWTPQGPKDVEIVDYH